ncbi:MULTISPECIES: PilW family protein [Luteibacter]|uniref:PilW family protein n=1 Tax=Luteibacter flocculans TaxID=2780091 RepID=A0ABY4T6Z3_9GAMM|nr:MULTISPECIES: PilW family protein [Luteibacter]URL60381.1 PilW family protein [Luteibacter flocculans]SFW35335.1 type IV pilus assembly protein PilW [Luteibacter sp. UNCMF366Tsu5.1]
MTPSRMHSRLLSATRGFSLIELMVGIVISIICTLGMMAAFSAYESQKRTTTNGSDAQQNGSFSTFMLEREIRTAGSALVQGRNYGIWGCAIDAWSGGTKRLPLTAALAAPFDNWPLTTRAVPVLVAAGTGDKADVIGIVRGNPIARTFRTNMVSASGTTVTVDNTMAIFPGEYLLMSDKSGKCTFGLVSTVNGTSIGLDTAGSASDGFSAPAHYTASLSAYIFDMGVNPAVTLFSVNQTNNSLVGYDLLQRGAASGASIAPYPLADNVVQLKTLYGLAATPSDVTVDSWVKPTGTTWGIAALTPTPDTQDANNARSRIRAIRIAVVVRSRQQERAAPASAASSDVAYIGYTGSTTLTLFGDLDATLQYSVTTDPTYRYKVYDLVIPVRNNLITKFF